MSEGKKKPVRRTPDSLVEAGMPKPEVKPGEQKAQSRKRKAVVKSEENTSAIDTPHSAITKSEIEHPTSEITKMEVHHHPQLEHKPKPWKEYFLEFIMIFLAVTMGFFAETMRENISESGKAKELAESLYKEVYTDSVTMHNRMMLREEKDRRMEYFRRYVRDSSLTTLPDRFYPTFTWSFVLTSTIIFDPNDGMLTQLRNSGALRYFKNIELQNALSRMNDAILNVRNRNGQEYAFVSEFTRPFILKHYDFNWQDEFTQNGKLSILQAIAQTDFHAKIHPVIRNLKDFKRDEADALAGYYLLIIRATRQVFYTPYIEANHHLLQELRKTYHFGNE